MAGEPGLAGIAVVGHRSLGEVAALVGPDHHAAGTGEADGGRYPEEHGRDPGLVVHSGGDHNMRHAWRARADPLYTSRMKSLSFLLVTLVACGGAPESVNQPAVAPSSASGAPAKRAVSGDVSFELPMIEIKGAVYEPDALGRPGMPLYEPKRKTTLDKQRAQVSAAKDPVQKQAYAAVLATMLYLDSKTNKASEKALLSEARQVLRDVAQLAGDKAIDEVTLRMLGSYELLLEDYPAAEKAWQTLIDKDPKNKETPYNRAWLVYALLKQYKNAAALAAATAGDKLDDKQPELAYATAWAKWRNSDPTGAWQALGVAVKGWGQNVNRDDLERDVFLFAGRGSVPLDQAQVLVSTALAKTKVQQYELLAKLGVLGYSLAGDWSDAVAALDKALDTGGDAILPNDRVVIRYSQADFTVPLDTPEVASAFAKQALDALAACGAGCNDKDKDNTVQRIYYMGRLFHNLYATANDRRYYQPAHDLYGWTIPLLGGGAARADAQKVSDLLEKTLKSTKPGTGTHDKGTLGALLNRHNNEVTACYETGLGANPKLAGTVMITLESDATGAIKGVTTEPKAGAADVSAVAGCIAQRAKQWKLPRRGMAGATRIKMSYALSAKK